MKVLSLLFKVFIVIFFERATYVLIYNFLIIDLILTCKKLSFSEAVLVLTENLCPLH